MKIKWFCSLKIHALSGTIVYQFIPLEPIMGGIRLKILFYFFLFFHLTHKLLAPSYTMEESLQSSFKSSSHYESGKNRKLCCTASLILAVELILGLWD